MKSEHTVKNVSIEYLKMVDEQLREAEDNMKSAEKAYLETKAKHKALLGFRESYLKWVNEQ